MDIHVIGDHPTVRYAGEELAKYLAVVSGERSAVVIRQSHDPGQAGLWLGTSDQLPDAGVPGVADVRMNDAIGIRIAGGNGVIAGANPRSVLLAAYRYLHELGYRWVRPGADGEYLPRVSNADRTVEVAESASYRHRGICIEGAVSYEHVRDLIEWMPKVGFNAYFTQFREAHTFFARWYNSLPGAEPFTVEKAREILAKVVADIKQRDLIYHAVGHGWTCEPFGISGLGWDRETREPAPKVAQYLALVKGKREFWHGVPLNTNLCYSNPEVRRIITDEIAGYAQSHPEIDLLHFWLADGSNNQCECDECSKLRPSDFYVMMLNELDRKLSQMGVPTRIVFLIYVDLLWPPERERIQNPDRFVLMFAPITRSYSKPFAPEAALPEALPYVRNSLEFPRSVESNLSYLKEWQRSFVGDSFDFDYHFMWDHYHDPGYVQMAQVLQRDIQFLGDIGIDGYVSCQVQRAFLPTGLGMAAMGWTLWNKRCDFDRLAADYFAAAFGPDSAKCHEYLTQLSELFDPVYLRGEKPAESAEAATSLARIPDFIAAFRPVIEKNVQAQNPCWVTSWRYLQHHANIYEELSQALEARARGDQAVAWQRWQAVEEMVKSHRDVLHPVLDDFFFLRVNGGRFKQA